MKKFLIIWNVALTFFIAILWLNFVVEDKSSYDIHQIVVLCGYIEDLQNKTGIDTTTTNDCQGDIDLLFEALN